MSSDMIALINLYSKANLKVEEGEEEKGNTEGREEEKARIAMNMLKANRPSSEIMEFTGISMNQLKGLRAGMSGR